MCKLFSQIISCLSEIIRKDIVTENTQRISKGEPHCVRKVYEKLSNLFFGQSGCRKQVRYLLAAKVQLESTGVDGMYKICRYCLIRKIIFINICGLS